MIGGFLSLVAACGTRTSPGLIASSQSNFDKAVELFSEGNYTVALPLFDECISAGALDPDQYAESLLLRAQCRALSGEIALAEEDIEAASQGAPSDALVHYTKAILYHAQGKTKESKEFFARASRLNSSLKAPSWLP